MDRCQLSVRWNLSKRCQHRWANDTTDFPAIRGDTSTGEQRLWDGSIESHSKKG